MTTEKKIDPKAWRVLGQLIYKGITYGGNEPLPEMTLAEAEMCERNGSLIRVNADGSVATALRRQLLSAEDYLNAVDATVLQDVLEQRPSVSMVKEMLGLVRASQRSKVLENALALAVSLMEAGKEPKRRGRPPRQR
jgi:hypothetical protein